MFSILISGTLSLLSLVSAFPVKAASATAALTAAAFVLSHTGESFTTIPSKSFANPLVTSSSSILPFLLRYANGNLDHECFDFGEDEDETLEDFLAELGDVEEDLLAMFEDGEFGEQLKAQFNENNEQCDKEVREQIMQWDEDDREDYLKEYQVHFSGGRGIKGSKEYWEFLNIVRGEYDMNVESPSGKIEKHNVGWEKDDKMTRGIRLACLCLLNDNKHS
jgi:hypothetical protein